MKHHIIFFALLAFLFACETAEDSSIPPPKESILLSAKNASGPYFTKNHKDQLVLVWTEELATKAAGHIVKYAIWDEAQAAFGEAISVSSSKGCRAHDESMSKLAFKADGTAIVVYSKRKATAENRFAGALYYSQSFDDGQHWTAPQYLHVGDTTAGLSRSFFDIARLADGEIGAIWLDSRQTKKRGDGSSLYFAKTEGKAGFVKDQQIGKSTCECCRTELFVAQNGDIHTVYRDIWLDSIRDMSHQISRDNGQSFTAAERISEDDWAINACPHTGPSMGETAQALHYVWYTMGGGSGLYYTQKDKASGDFTDRKLLSTSARHPQLLAMNNERLVFVWEDGGQSSHAGHHGGGAATKASSTSNTVIKAQLWQDGYPTTEHWVSTADRYAEYPVVAQLSDRQIAIAWVQEAADGSYGVWCKILFVG